MKATVVTLDQARRRLTHPVPAEEADAEAPPLLRETGLLVDGEVPLDQAASGRTPQPGPPRPDGSYTPHGLREGYTPEKPVPDNDENVSVDKSGNKKGNNPPLWILVLGGMGLSGAILLTEALLIPGDAAPPPIDVGAATLSVFLVDVEVAYWAYVYRVMVHPTRKQNFILLPPWGLNR